MAEKEMISVQQALQILKANMPRPRQNRVGLEEAFGCFLHADIRAPEPSPRYTSSAMDGYALRWIDCAGVSENKPATLKVIGESQAGVPFAGTVASGCAVRISTGAVVPSGADTVVRMEDTREGDEIVEILAVQALGQDIRQAGEEFAEGELLFAKGSRLGPRELALLAAVGMSSVPVYAPPRVSLLITGTELARADETAIKPYQIRDSNSVMLAAAIREAGGILSACSHIADNFDQTVAAVQQAAESGADLILCSGGVSVGRHDHVKEAALAAGFTELFWKIRQKPGKPLFVGRRGATLLFGLPGNPVSAYMCFSNYVRPVLAELLGSVSITRTLTAQTTAPVSNRGSRTNFIRVNIESRPQELAKVTEMVRQGSHMLSTIVHADGYIILEPGESVEAGGLIEVYLF